MREEKQDPTDKWPRNQKTNSYKILPLRANLLMSVPFLNLKVLRSNQQRNLCEYESDLRINEHYYSSSENMA